MLLQKNLNANLYQINNFKVRKLWKNVRNSIFVYTEHAKFQKASLIATEMQSNETKCFGSIPSPHQVHSCAIVLVIVDSLHWSLFGNKTFGP